MDDLITLAEAARRLDLAPTTLRDQVRRGRLAAKKIGRDWLVTEAEVERYRADSLGRPGRPFKLPSEEPPPRPRFYKWSDIKRKLGADDRARVDEIKREMDDIMERTADHED
jgi:excisionase family DNA binding protein